MSEALLIEQLDQAIEALLARGEKPAVDDRIGELVSVAAELRDLPRAEFKARLKTELEREANMSTAARAKKTGKSSPAKEEPVRQEQRTVTPYVVVSDVHATIGFIKEAFGADGRVYGLGSQGGFHAEYQIGGSTLMIGGGGKGSKWKGTPSPAALHLYIEDVDATYQRALQAGAKSLYAPIDHGYGERGAAVQDPGGSHWYLATSAGESYVPEGASSLMPVFHPQGAPKMIDFLKQSFGAEEIAVHQSPDGTIQHAKLRIGNSIVEMGETHGEWQPMPMHFMMQVDDADAAYERAMKAEGAISVGAPANQPYGGRSGAIQDPFGNTWYLSSKTKKKEDGPAPSRRITMAAPKLFRVALQVADLDQASAFYATLLDDPGIRIPRGSRHYFDCGPVILALVDVAKGAAESPQPTPDYIYFAVSDLAEVFERAKTLNCLAKDRFHDQNAGEIVKRPWGELSFYAEDPWGNGLCFVDEKTLFTGK